VAALAWLKPRSSVFVVVAVFAAAFVILDIAEMVHQLDRSRGGLAALAAIIGLAHAGVVAGAVGGVMTGRADARSVAAMPAH